MLGSRRAALLQLHLPDVLSIALLDVLHSLLALMGATEVPGIVQAMLIHGTVPAVALFAALIPPVPASADDSTSGGDGSASGADGAGRGARLRAAMLRPLAPLLVLIVLIVCVGLVCVAIVGARWYRRARSARSRQSRRRFVALNDDAAVAAALELTAEYSEGVML